MTLGMERVSVFTKIVYIDDYFVISFEQLRIVVAEKEMRDFEKD